MAGSDNRVEFGPPLLLTDKEIEKMSIEQITMFIANIKAKSAKQGWLSNGEVFAHAALREKLFVLQEAEKAKNPPKRRGRPPKAK